MRISLLHHHPSWMITVLSFTQQGSVFLTLLYQLQVVRQLHNSPSTAPLLLCFKSWRHKHAYSQWHPASQTFKSHLMNLTGSEKKCWLEGFKTSTLKPCYQNSRKKSFISKPAFDGQDLNGFIFYNDM